MNVQKIPQMDETYKSYIVNMVMNDDNVQFHWSIAGFDTDEENEQCLYSIHNQPYIDFICIISDGDV